MLGVMVLLLPLLLRVRAAPLPDRPPPQTFHSAGLPAHLTKTT